MNSKLTENKTFDKLDYTKHNLVKGEYDTCTFINCNFSNTDLSDITFIECVFDSCDLSLAKISNTAFNDIKFINCKLLGLHFDDCNDLLLTVYFENCIIKLSSFYKLKLKKTKFKNCNLQDTDFTETDLSNSIFDNCDLQRAIFESTNLEKTDFYSSYNFSFDPEKNRMGKAIFSQMGIKGLLDKYDIEIK